MGLKSTLRVVLRMYQLKALPWVRRKVMADGVCVREPSQVFGLHWDTVRKMPDYLLPPGYRWLSPPLRPKSSTISVGALHLGHRPH